MKTLRRILSLPFIGIIKLYQVLISPILGPKCRFTPTCSTYAIEALKKYGILKGSWLAIKRISRCHPWGGHGYDPVPWPKKDRANKVRHSNGTYEKKAAGYSDSLYTIGQNALRIAKSFGYFFPVDCIPYCSEVVGALILVFEVISMLPYIYTQ